MKARVLAAAAAVVVSITGGLAVAGPAVAASEPAPKCTFDPAVAVAADRAESDRIWVRFLATSDPRKNLNSAAWAALLSSNPKATIARFVQCGYDYSSWYARQEAARNADFARRVVATHTVEYSPHVHAAAQLALEQGTQALAAFARTGYAAAKKQDKEIREADAKQAEDIVLTDRLFVEKLRKDDPGPQVRAAAGMALSDGSTSALVEFFAFDWASAARLDLDMYRTARANQEAQWRRTVLGLVAEAKVAEAEAIGAAGKAWEQQERAEAALAWAKVGPTTVEPRSAWAEAQRVAVAQAENWRQVAVAAAAATATNSNWGVIAGSAESTGEQWTTERTSAATMSTDWTALYEQALAGERRMQPPAG